MDTWMDGWIIQMNEYVDGWMDGWIYVWMDGYMDEWILMMCDIDNMNINCDISACKMI